jgi:hypothetical protein
VPEIVCQEPLYFTSQSRIKLECDDRTKSAPFNRSQVFLRVHGNVPHGNATRLATVAEISTKFSHEWVGRLRQRLPAFDASLQLWPESEVIEKRQLEVASHVIRIHALRQELQGTTKQIEDGRMLLPFLGKTGDQLNHV